MADPTSIQSVSRRTSPQGRRGVAGLGGVPAFLAACSSSAATARPPRQRRRLGAGRAGAGRVAAAGSVGRRHAAHRQQPLRPRREGGHGRHQRGVHGRRPGSTVVMNTVDHGTFQDQITNYLGGTPDTAYTWFSGFRMKFFADQGLNIADRRRVGHGQGQLHRRLRQLGRRQRRQGLRHPGRLLPVGGLLPEERLRGQGLHDPDDLGRAQDARAPRCRRTA